MRTVDTPKARAEDLCARINGSLGWRAANPEHRDGGYTGAIVLRERTAEVVTGQVQQHGVRENPITRA
jgi:hypothetical protein